MKKMTIIATMFIVLFFATMTTEAATTVASETMVGYTIKVTQTKTTTRVYWNGRLIRRYKFSGRVKIVPERFMSRKMLTHRKNKTLYIERVTGFVTNKRLDGISTCGGYISYKAQAGKVKPGDVVVSYCVYNPHNNYIDAIDERYDVFIK